MFNKSTNFIRTLSREKYLVVIRYRSYKETRNLSSLSLKLCFLGQKNPMGHGV